MSPLARFAIVSLTAMTTGSASGQYAVDVVDYEPGTGVNSGYDQPTAALGEPTRMSGIPDVLPSTVTPFQPAYMPGEIVTIGLGGSITLEFSDPIYDDPANPFGIDLLIFGNAFFTSTSNNTPCTNAIYDEGGIIEVSLDGEQFIPIDGVSADGLFPTMGYRDAAAFAIQPGVEETDFLLPVNPTHAAALLDGLCWEELLEIYDGSGGGTPIDLAPTGLTSIRFVRITVPKDAVFLPELDAIADVAPVVEADINRDGTVTGADLTLLLSAWGSADVLADLDQDGTVTGSDLTILLSAWSA